MAVTVVVLVAVAGVVVTRGAKEDPDAPAATEALAAAVLLKIARAAMPAAAAAAPGTAAAAVVIAAVKAAEICQPEKEMPQQTRQSALLGTVSAVQRSFYPQGITPIGMVVASWRWKRQRQPQQSHHQ